MPGTWTRRPSMRAIRTISSPAMPSASTRAT
nr:MAG TPA: hypothetical protein [Caudoviricetes sp.]